MDWAVQKCVETGVSVLMPLLVERSQLGARAAAGRVEHWRRAARQALKQCRRPWQMEVASPQGIEQLLSGMNGVAGLVADAAGRPLGEHRGPLPEVLVVGPEGGLAPARNNCWPRRAAGRAPRPLGAAGRDRSGRRRGDADRGARRAGKGSGP
jgi:RsmE family RNA methyltransferase